MVNAPENRSFLTGKILGRKAHPTLADYDFVELAVARADDVEGFRNLLSPTVGSTILVAARRELLGAAEAGQELRCPARRTPDGAMADANPEPGAFTVGKPRRRTARKPPPSPNA
ncbi:MAG: hypothetical protein ACKVVT_07860 [Dehalococcoidia bacterium]